MSRWTALAVLLASGVFGCSGASASATSPDPAHVAQQVSEPRTDDPTAAQGVPIPETRKTAVTTSTGASSGKTAPAGTAAAAPVDAPNTAPAPPAGEPAAAAPAAEQADTPRKISARHVLIQFIGADRATTSVLRSRDQALALIEEVLRRAKAGEDLGRLAREYSDEPNAGARGGSLGRFARGQMVPQFDNVAFHLKVGEISGIVETPFGFHVIQRTE